MHIHPVNMPSNFNREPMSADVLVVGSGLAGLLLALELSRLDLSVMLVSKGRLIDSNTSVAQGGVAAVTPAGFPDALESHLNDTIASGAGLCDPAAARLIVVQGAALIRRLRELGVHFDVGMSGRLKLAREGGHSHARVVHSKDATGRSIASALVDAVRQSRSVVTLEDCFVLDLLLADGRCTGASVLVKGERLPIRAGQVVLATGGAGQIYARTTNPDIATGDGMALAFRAGARLVDMEFVQFHPTALFKPGAPPFLISEAARGAGAVLVDSEGRRFAARFHADAELATRDVVARGILSVMREQDAQCVWLDLRPIGSAAITARFPNIVSRCRQLGIDPVCEPIPVCPAAHYFIGGVLTDLNGSTTLPGLYAIGECASTGLHGANRLASNSLLEAGVMAMRLAAHIAQTGSLPRSASLVKPQMAVSYAVPADPARFRQLMYEKAGVERAGGALNALLTELSISQVRAVPATRQVGEYANMLQVAQLIAQAGLARQESRGSHYRLDYPQRDDERFLRRLTLSRAADGGSPVLEWIDVPAPVPTGGAAAPALL